jgi:hypothetical protein
MGRLNPVTPVRVPLPKFFVVFGTTIFARSVMLTHVFLHVCPSRCVGYIFLSNDLFLSVESFKKNYINCNSNITKYHYNNNYLIIIKYYFIYHDNNIYINNTNTYSKNKNFIIT